MVSLHDIDALPDDAIISAGQPIPRIESVEPAGEFRLRVTWKRGGGAPETVEINVAPAIFNHRGFIPLRTDPAMFAKVAADGDGNFVYWPDGSEMDAHHIDIMPRADMTNAEFREIMDGLGYTLDGMGYALGIARRNVASYRKDKPVPPVVALATREVARQAKPEIISERVFETGLVERVAKVATGKVGKLPKNEKVHRKASAEKEVVFMIPRSASAKPRTKKRGEIV